MIDRFLRVSDALCLFGACCAGALLLALACLGLIDILLLSLFATTLPFSVEYSGYLLGLALFAGSGWTLQQSSHIRVKVLFDHLPVAARRWLDLIATLFALGVAVFLAIALVDYGLRTWARGTVSYHPSQTPLAYPQLMFAVGPCILVLALLARAIRLLRGSAPEKPSS